MKLLGAIAFLALMSSCAPGAPQRPPDSATAASTFTESRNGIGETVRVITNKTFSLTRVFIDGVDYPVLFLQEVSQTRTEGIHGVQGSVKVTAFRKTGDTYSNELWEFSDTHQEAHLAVLGDYECYETSTSGSLDEEPTYSYYHLADGRLLFSGTKCMALRDWVNGEKRFMSYFSASADQGPPDLPQWKGAAAKLTLFLEGRELDRVYLRDEVAWTTPEIEEQGGSLVLTWPDKRSLTLPIRDGRFLPNQATGELAGAVRP